MAAAPQARIAVRVLQERASRAERPRVPEPMVMDDAESVAAFHDTHPILQLPVYRVNALALSALLPEGGHVLDLGSGTGRLLAHLASARHDVGATGTDLAPNMLRSGREWLTREGLADRVQLQEADMTALPENLPSDPDVVSCIWALHHLPTADQARRCLREVSRLRERSGCAVWIFDFARLRRDATIASLMRLAEDAPGRLKEDGIASERAAWTAKELRTMLDDAGLGDLRGGGERVVGHLQAYWAPARDGRPSAHAARWCGEPLPGPASAIVKRLRFGLPSLP